MQELSKLETDDSHSSASSESSIDHTSDISEQRRTLSAAMESCEISLESFLLARHLALSTGDKQDIENFLELAEGKAAAFEMPHGKLKKIYARCNEIGSQDLILRSARYWHKSFPTSWVAAAAHSLSLPRSEEPDGPARIFEEMRQHLPDKDEIFGEFRWSPIADVRLQTSGRRYRRRIRPRRRDRGRSQRNLYTGRPPYHQAFRMA